MGGRKRKRGKNSKEEANVKINKGRKSRGLVKKRKDKSYLKWVDEDE